MTINQGMARHLPGSLYYIWSSIVSSVRFGVLRKIINQFRKPEKVTQEYYEELFDETDIFRDEYADCSCRPMFNHWFKSKEDYAGETELMIWRVDWEEDNEYDIEEGHEIHFDIVRETKNPFKEAWRTFRHVLTYGSVYESAYLDREDLKDFQEKMYERKKKKEEN